MPTTKKRALSSEQKEVDDLQASKRSRRSNLSESEEPNDAPVDIDEKKDESLQNGEIEEKVAAMTLKSVKEELKKRDLSVKGVDKVVRKRLSDRLLKECDPEYKPREKGRHCKWCGALMVKKSVRYGEDRWGRFYGCSAYPTCQYTTNLNGYARPEREHLKGVPAFGH